LDLNSKSKGQLISKCIFFQKKEWKNSTYVTSIWIVFVRFWEELKTPKRHFEINWPLKTIWATLKVVKPWILQNKQTIEFMRRVFVHFLEEIEDSKKAFRNYLTFKKILGSVGCGTLSSQSEFMLSMYVFYVCIVASFFQSLWYG